MRKAGATIAALSLFTLVVPGCSPEPAVLQVDLEGEATASPQFFHGNCFAGYSIAVTLRVTETQGVDVVLDLLSYRISDSGSGVDVVIETLDSAALEERFGAGAKRIPGRGGRIFRVGAIVSHPVGPLTVIGEARGRDRNDARVSKTFQFTSPLRIEEAVPPGSGACTPP